MARFFSSTSNQERDSDTFSALRFYRAVAIGFLCTFSVFFLTFASVKLLYPDQLTSFDDPYFHARYAELRAENGAWPAHPYLSTMNWFGGGSIYYGYHTLLAMLVDGANATESDERLLLVTKLFGAFWAAMVYAVFFVVTVLLMRPLFPHATTRSLLAWAACSTFALPIVFSSLVIRLSYERPFVLSVILMLVLLYALAAKRRKLLFVTGVLLPLMYSFTLIAYIPLCIYAITQLRIYGWGGWRESVRAIATFTAGFVVGVVLHPSSLHYVFNANYIHLIVLKNSLSGSVPVGAEIQPHIASIVDYPWIGLSALLIVVFAYLWKKHELDIERHLLFLTALSVAYIPLQILFPRTVEYYAPVAILAGTLYFLYLKTEHGQLLNALAGQFTTLQKKLCAGALALFVGLWSFGSVYAMAKVPAHWSPSQGVELYRELRQHASPGDRVVLPAFHTYTTAFFYLPELNYNQGMDPTFSLVASSSAFWLLHHATMGSEPVCPHAWCGSEQASMDVYEVIHTVHDARFVVLDYFTSGTTSAERFPKYMTPLLELASYYLKPEGPESGAYQQNPYETFAEKLNSDKRFKALYDKTGSGRRFLLWEVLDDSDVVNRM